MDLKTFIENYKKTAASLADSIVEAEASIRELMAMKQTVDAIIGDLEEVSNSGGFNRYGVMEKKEPTLDIGEASEAGDKTTGCGDCTECSWRSDGNPAPAETGLLPDCGKQKDERGDSSS